MKTHWYNKKIEGINSISERLNFIGLTTLLAFLFVHIFEPLGVYNEPSSSASSIFIELTLAIFFASIVLILSQFVFRQWVKLTTFHLYSFILWFLLDTVSIGLVWFVLSYSGDEENIGNLIFETILGSFFIFLIPYWSAMFILSQRFKNKNASLLPHPSINTEVIPPQKIIFYDEKNIERLTILAKNVLYLQSQDNYVAIIYLEGEKAQQFLLRNSIKRLSSSLAEYSILRCHRSYMVNTENIISKKRKGNGMELSLQSLPNKIIPVSRAYFSEFEKLI